MEERERKKERERRKRKREKGERERERVRERERERLSCTHQLVEWSHLLRSIYFQLSHLCGRYMYMYTLTCTCMKYLHNNKYTVHTLIQ